MANSVTRLFNVLEDPIKKGPINVKRIVLDTTGTDLVVHEPASNMNVFLKGVLLAESNAANLTIKQRSPVLTGTVSTVNGTLTLTVVSATDVWTASAAHGLTTGQPVMLETSDTLPAGTDDSTVYFVAVASDTTFKLYDTAENAIADDGSTGLIDVSDTGTGTHGFNGAVIFGTGTAFDDEHVVGDEIVIEDGSTLTVQTIDSATQITATAEATSTVTGKKHQRQESFGAGLELAANQDIIQGVQKGKWLVATDVGHALVLNSSAAISSITVFTQEAEGTV